jgi:hypothetical protein
MNRKSCTQQVPADASELEWFRVSSKKITAAPRSPASATSSFARAASGGDQAGAEAGAAAGEATAEDMAGAVHSERVAEAEALRRQHAEKVLEGFRHLNTALRALESDAQVDPKPSMPYIVDPIPQPTTPNPTQYTMHHTPCTPNPTPHVRSPKPCPLIPNPSTLNPKSRTLLLPLQPHTSNTSPLNPYLKHVHPSILIDPNTPPHLTREPCPRHHHQALESDLSESSATMSAIDAAREERSVAYMEQLLAQARGIQILIPDPATLNPNL